VTAGPPRRHLLVLGVGTVALAALHLWIARDVSLPARGPGDQWGYVGSARFLAGAPNPYVMPSFPYFTYGYPLVLAPVVRATSDPEDLFLGIKVVNAVLAASLLPLLHALARRVLAASRAHALAAASVGAVVPAVVARPSTILAENLVLPLVVATLLAIWLLLTERPAWQRLLAGPAVVWLHVTHNRFALTLVLFAGLLLLLAWRRTVPRWVVAVNGAAALVLLAGAQLVRDAIVAARWTFGIHTPQGPASDAVELLTEPRLVGELLLVAAGQAWYLGVTTLGLSLFGVWVMAGRATARGAARPGGARRLDDPTSLVLGFTLLSALTVLATSAYFFTRVPNGSEGYVAGRHNDSFVPVWVAAGTLFLLTASIDRLRRVVWTSTVAVAALTALLLWQRDSTELGSFYTALNVPGLAHHGLAGAEVVRDAAAIGIGSLALVSLLAWAGRRPTALVPVAAAWLLVVVAARIEPSAEHEGWATPAQVERLGIDRAAAIQARDAAMPVYYPYFLPELHFVPWDGTGAPPERVVVAPLDFDLARRGGRIAAIDEPVRIGLRPPHAMAVWVLPGPEQDRLLADGALLPMGFPTALPAEARLADLEVPRGGLRAPAGGDTGLTVKVRHAGTGAPWPDAGSAGALGSVRLVARLDAGTADRPVIGAAELPHWTRPGDRVTVELPIEAADGEGRPLRPGRYEVVIDLEQRGFGAFSPTGEGSVRLVLDVPA
jgi:hypothetical protein